VRTTAFLSGVPDRLASCFARAVRTTAFLSGVPDRLASRFAPAVRTTAFLFAACARFASQLARHRLSNLERPSGEAFLYSAFNAHTLEVILECPVFPQ